MEKKLQTTSLIAVFTKEGFEYLKKQSKGIEKDAWIIFKGSLLITSEPMYSLKNLSFLDELESSLEEKDFVIFSDEALNILNIEDSDIYSRQQTYSPKKFFYIVKNPLGNFFITVKLNGESKKPTLTIKNMDGLKLIKIHKDFETGKQTYSEYFENIKD